MGFGLGFYRGKRIKVYVNDEMTVLPLESVCFDVDG